MGNFYLETLKKAFEVYIFSKYKVRIYHILLTNESYFRVLTFTKKKTLKNINFFSDVKTLVHF